MQNEQSATDSTLRDEDKSDNPTNPNGNVPDTSVDKGTTISKTSKEKAEKNAVPSVQEQVEGKENVGKKARHFLCLKANMPICVRRDGGRMV